MIIKSLSLDSFRNFKEEKLIPCDGVNVIYGDNAQGKTNILEAIWLFTGSKSFRSSRDQDYIPIKPNSFSDDALDMIINSPYARLELEFFGRSRLQNAKIQIKDGKKKAFLNEIEKSSISKLSGEFLGVYFFPGDLSIVKDSPSVRRKFIDGVLSSLYPKYISYLSDYNKLLLQRNALLKDIKYNNSLFDILSAYDSQLVVYGANIIMQRKKALNSLIDIAREIYDGISDQREEFSFRYLPGLEGYNEDMTLDELKSAYGSCLKAELKQDIASGCTFSGAHRDDIEFFINGVSAKNFGSQGQQRSIALALKLALSPLIHSITGERPVIILDDVMSELDKKRKEYILNHVKDNQIFISCCDKNDLVGLEKGKSFLIKNGKIESTQEL